MDFFDFMFKMTSSESESDAVWKRRAAPVREEIPESTYWASPPKAKRHKGEQGGATKSRGKSKPCLVTECEFQITNMHKHIKFHHLPACCSKSIKNDVDRCVDFLKQLALALELSDIDGLLEYVTKNKMYHSDPVEMTPLDLDNINLIANKLGESLTTNLQLKKVDKKAHLIHWTVASRVLAKLDQDKREELNMNFPSPAVLNKLENRKVYIFGDSIVRNLEENLKYKVPVACAPGVTMCKPHKEKWLARLWVPVLEVLLDNAHSQVPPHLVFHLGTNNISNGRRKAAAEVEKEACQLCAKIWKFQKFASITFSAVLPRSTTDQEAVQQVNHRLRVLGETDSRLSFIDFGRELKSSKFYTRDQVHLSADGKARFGTCFSEYLLSSA